MANFKKIGINIVGYAMLFTAVIIIAALIKEPTQKIVVGLGWNLCPYLLIYFIYKKIENDRYLPYHFILLLFSTGTGLLILIFGSLIGHDAFIPLVVPFYQIYAYIILYLIIKFIRKIVSRKEKKDKL